MNQRAAWRLLGFAAVCGAAVAACTGGADPQSVADPSVNGGGKAVDAGLGESGQPDPGFGEDDAGGGGPTVARVCSSDLRSVLDEQGNVVQSCPPDQGCGGGRCVAACDAAAASHGNVGCDFVVATPSFYPGVRPPCFAVFVANNWVKPVKLRVSRAGASFDATAGWARIAAAGQPSTWAPVPATGIPEGKVAVLFLSDDPASVNGTPLKCPVTPAVSTSGGTAVPNSGPAGTGRGSAWHVVTDAPVSAYDIHPYGGAKSYLPSAELILPTSAWGKNFVGVVPPKGNRPSDPNTAQWVQLVASQDATTVKIVPKAALPAGTGVTAAPANVVTTYTLSAGQYIQWQPTGEVSGTVVEADKPIAFVGGQAYLCLGSATSSGGGCDSGHQIVPPVSALGSEYVGAPYLTRRQGNKPESVPYRIVGTVAGTTLTYDPPVTGAPAAITVGQMVDFESTHPFVVRSQDANHPFYLGQSMTGCSVQEIATGGLGDEEFVNVLPPAQFLSKYVFFTDPTYPTTNLVFVRKKSAAAKDVMVTCQGNPAPWAVTGWTAAGGGYEIAYADLMRLGSGVHGCANGPQSASSGTPFGIVVWGLDNYSSYAYPAGGNVATINTVVVPPVPR